MAVGIGVILSSRQDQRTVGAGGRRGDLVRWTHLLRAGCIAALVAGIGLVGASPASADNNTRYWSNNPYAGFCGNASGGVVAAAQAAVFAKRGTIANDYVVDGQFGQISYNQVFAYQVQRGLQADGCVGPQTWASLQSGLVIDTSFGPHPNLFLPGANGHWALYDYTRYSTGCFWTYNNQHGAPEAPVGGSIAYYRYYRFVGGSFPTLSPTSSQTTCY